MSSILKVDTIQTSDGSKQLAGPGPTFKAYKSASQTGNTANGSVKVTFETEVWDSDSCYDTSTSKFTPNLAGYYIITAQLEIAHTSTGARTMAVLWKNGATYAESAGSHGDSNFYPSSRGTWIVPMNGTTDYVEAYSYGTNNGSAYDFATNTVYRCTFEGAWMRPL